MKWKIGSLFLAIVLSVYTAHAEDEISLDDVEDVATTTSAHSPARSAKSFNFFGKMDLTADFSPYEREQVTSNGNFETQHFLVFFNAQSGRDIHVQAEIIDKSFYYVNYKLSEHSKLLFGKIVVPFGETNHYHRLYGGNVNRDGSGIMFPNIWAEKGLNFNTQLGAARSHLDLYWVNGFTSVDGDGNPVLNIPSDGSQQAGGLRWTYEGARNLRGRFSYYYTDIGPDLDLHGLGLDVFTKMSLGSRWLKSVDLTMGVARFDVQKKNAENFYKQGDFASLQFYFPAKNRLRLRYGTYDNNHRTETVDDTKSWSLAYLRRMKSLLLMVEHQWNMEQVSEVDNDILRMMASVEF